MWLVTAGRSSQTPKSIKKSTQNRQTNSETKCLQNHARNLCTRASAADFSAEFWPARAQNRAHFWSRTGKKERAGQECRTGPSEEMLNAGSPGLPKSCSEFVCPHFGHRFFGAVQACARSKPRAVLSAGSQKITGSSTRPALNRNTARWDRSSLGTVAVRRCAPLDRYNIHIYLY